MLFHSPLPRVLTPTPLPYKSLPDCAAHILSPRSTQTHTGNSRQGLKNTPQMLLFGLFISCFKQLYFGTAPSQALSAGITALHRHHLLCTLPSCTRGQSRLIWKRKSPFESLPARWKRCQHAAFSLDEEQSPSGRRARRQLVGSPPARREHGGRGPAPGAAAAAAPERGAGGFASLQLDPCISKRLLGGQLQL